MASTPDPLLRVELQAAGENNNTWGAPKVNLALTDLAFAIAGRTAFALSGSKTLTANNYTADEARSMMLDVTSGTGGTVTVPAVSHVYMVRNATSGAVTLTVGSGATAAVATGNIGWVMVTGTDCYLVTTATATASSWTTARDFSFTGDATGMLLGVDGSANKSAVLTVSNSAITLPKMANMATNGLIGNNTGGSSVPLLLTYTQVTAALNVFVGDLGGTPLKGLVPAPVAGDAAAGKFLKADNTWAVPATPAITYPYCRARVDFTVNSPNTGGASVTINESYNVTSVVRNSQGNFTVNFTSNLSSPYYTPAGTVRKAAANNAETVTIDRVTGRNVAYCVLGVTDNAATSTDPAECSIEFVQ